MGTQIFVTDYGYCEENAQSMVLGLSDKTKRKKKKNLRGKRWGEGDKLIHCK